MKKRVSICIALGLSFMLTTSVMADPNTDLTNKQNELNQSKNLLNNARDRVENIQIKIEKLDADIENSMRESKKIEEKINKHKEGIKKFEANVEKTEKEVKEKQILYNKRVRTMYINGTDGYINMIFESKNFSDMFSKIESIKKITTFDRKIIKELREKKKELQDKRAKLIIENKKLEDVKKLEDDRAKKLEQDKKEQQKLIVEAKDLENRYKNEVSISAEEIRRIQEYIEQERQKAPKYEPSRGSANLNANSLVAYASNFLGTPYVWGGTSPNPGFDCSGFMQYVYGHFGTRIGRTTYEQINDGKNVGTNINQLQAGDLVFFGNAKSPHHVGMYIGNGWYIHSPSTGDVIKVSQLGSRRDFSAARRIQ